MSMFRRDPLLRKDRVQRLERFAHDTVEHVVKFRTRTVLAHKLEQMSNVPAIVRTVDEVVAEGRIVYPNSNFDVNLMDGITEHRLSDRATEVIPIMTFVPEEDTWCRYVVGSGKPLEVMDSQLDLVVHNSPYCDIVRSYLGYPICIQGWPVGAVCCYSGTPRNRPFTVDEHNQMAAWADRIAVVLAAELENAVT